MATVSRGKSTNRHFGAAPGDWPPEPPAGQADQPPTEPEIDPSIGHGHSQAVDGELVLRADEELALRTDKESVLRTDEELVLRTGGELMPRAGGEVVLR